MKTMKILGYILVIGLAIFVVVGFLVPEQWHVSRSIKIASSAEDINDFISDLKKWPEWTPWSYDSDKTLKYTYEGAESGAGAQENWTSEKMGNGWLKILSSDPNDGLKYELFMDIKGMKCAMFGDIKYDEQEDFTEVTWTTSGDSDKNIIKRWISIFTMRTLGKQLDQALANLKERVE